VSSFRVNDGGSLSLASVVPSGGAEPVSLAVHDNLLYVLNLNDNTLSGFRITGGAKLVALPHTTHSLATGANGAAAVRFTPDGRQLVVSERVSNRLEVFAVDENGRLGDPVVTAAVGSASFGFDITSRNQAIVSETQGSVTSYAISHSGALTPITSSITTGGQAACWVIISSNGRFAYSSNAGSNTIAGFAVANDGSLTSLTPGAPTGNAGAGASPIDLDQVGSRLLYILEAGRGTIGTFVIDNNGHLTSRPDTPVGTPASGFQGIAAF
jgi:6-phosphogluconolactonase (cycloisomerase 2 family)